MARQSGDFSRGGHDDPRTGQAAVTGLQEAVPQEVRRLSSGGESPSPEMSHRRASDTVFWGRAWRANLELYAAYAARLPWGKAYLATGQIHDVHAEKGVIRAMVTRPRAEPYSVTVKIRPITPARWKYLVQQCAGKIDSMDDLLQGRLPDSVLQVLTDRAVGLLPYPAEIDFETNCPEWASAGKHVRALLNGFGARLDEEPGLLFELRGVQQADLITGPGVAQAITSPPEHEATNEDAYVRSSPVGSEVDTAAKGAHAPSLQSADAAAARAIAPVPRSAPVPAIAPPSPSPVFPAAPQQELPPTATPPAPAKRPVAPPKPGKQTASAGSSRGRAAKANPVAEPVRSAEGEGGSLSIIRRDDLIARHVPTEVIDFWIEQGLLCAHGADDVFLLTATISSRVEKFEMMGRRKGRR